MSYTGSMQKLGTGVAQFGTATNPIGGLENLFRGFGEAAKPGGYQQFGLTDEDIAKVLQAQRGALGQQNEAAFGAGLRGLAQNASARGFGQSGAVAQGAVGLHKSLALQQAAQEAALAQLAAQYINQRQYVYRPGLLEQLVPGLMQLGGQLGGAALGNPALMGMG